MKLLSLKNHQQETQLFQSRSFLLLSTFLLSLLLIILRLIYLQGIEHQFYKTLSRQNVVDIIPIAPKRGLIFDRHGKLLAKNTPSFSLVVIPEQVQHLNQTVHALSQWLPVDETDLKQFRRQLKQHRRYEPVTLKSTLSEQAMNQFYVNRYLYPGVDVQANLIRHYPAAANTAHLVGYVGRLNAADMKQLDLTRYAGTQVIGRSGIEKQFESTLHGTPGSEEVEIDASGRIVRTLHKAPPIAGKNLYLTIDSDLEAKIYGILQDKPGAVVVVNPQNGEILALVSNPSYDPNLFVNGISKIDYQALLHADNQPLIDRTIHAEFAAASTVKPFYAIEGLDTETITPTTRIYDRGWYQIPHTEHIYHDWVPHGHGWTNVSKAIMVSCDIFFYHLADQLGRDSLASILERFGFGHPTQIDLPFEKKGLIPSNAWKLSQKGESWYPGDTINLGIGQGYLLATPLQLAMATAALSMHGQYYKPKLILKTQADHQKIQEEPNTLLSEIKLNHNWVWDTVISAMHDVIFDPQGTAVYFGRHPPYSAAGKTGTAQIYGHTRDEYEIRTNLPKRLRNNQLFIGFAPVEHPEIAIAVIIEHDGSAPRVARQVMDAYFEEKAHENEQLSP